MLVELFIKNFALIKELKLELGSGLNILTGETGSGKSIIIKALDMLLGGRASNDYIRAGEEKAVIEGTFSFNNNLALKRVIGDLGVDIGGDKSLILTREVSVNGNNKTRINGRVVTLEMVKEITQYLIDIHGQHENQSLLNSDDHLDFLDEYGDKEISSLKDKVALIYQSLKVKQDKLNDLNYDEKERKRRIDLLEFEIKEIENAEIQLGEDEELLEEKKRLSNAEELSKVVAKGYAQLYQSDFEHNAVIDQIHQLAKEVDSISKIDSSLKEISDLLKEITYQVEDASFRLRDYEDQIEFNPERLAIVEERLDLINNLKRKYGDLIEDILKHKDDSNTELERLKNSQVEKEGLIEEIGLLEREYLEVAEKLSLKRKEMANNLSKKISQELKDLSMLETKIEIGFEKRQKFMINGLDKVEFLISTNPGSELKPLVKIASGGEISRVMLALKTITADTDQISTLIFDEIDTGIGGRVGKLIGDKLSLLSKKHQIICITHLPQIACMADSHYLIIKKIASKETETVIHRLSDNGRIRELARMLDGSLNDTTLEHAKELLKSAIIKKSS